MCAGHEGDGPRHEEREATDDLDGDDDAERRDRVAGLAEEVYSPSQLYLGSFT